MQNVYETIENEYTTIKIMHDDDPINPVKDYDQAGTMACWHKRYNLGHENPFTDPSEAQAFFKAEKAIYLPLYLYDHSGITMRTSPFSCSWDSGQVGYIYTTAEKIRQEYSCKRITKAIREKAIKLMIAEVESYNDYLTGNCYGYDIEDKDGNSLDSCWGFLGDPEYCIEEAKIAAQYYEKDIAEKTACALADDIQAARPDMLLTA